MRGIKGVMSFMVMIFTIVVSVSAQEVYKASVYFGSAQYEINPESKKVLDDVLATLKNKEDYSISVTGNTDDVGDSEYNLKLSESRVNSVKKFLLDRRIPQDAFSTAYFGEEKPISTNETDEGKSQNRRVDIEIHFKAEEPLTVSATPSILELYKLIERKPQEFIIDPTKDNSILCEQGTVIHIKANSFKLLSSCKDKEVTVKVREDFSKADMIIDNLSTSSNDRPLETAGMVYITANDCKGREIELARNEELTIFVPTDTIRPDIQLFNGEREGHNDMMNWTVNNTPELSDLSLEDILSCGRAICGPPPCEDRCKFWCRITRFDIAMKGLTDKGTHLDNVGFRKCQRKLRALERWEKRNGVPFNSSSNPNRWPELSEDMRNKCNYVDDMMKKYNVENVNDLILAMNKPLLDSFQVSTMLELRDTLEKVKLQGLETAYANSNISFEDYQYYVFNSNRMGWINLDEFSKMPRRKLAKVEINIKPASNIDCKLVFKQRNAVLPLYPDGNKYQIKDMPKGEQIWIVALKYEDNKPYFAMKEMEIGDKASGLNFEELSLEELKDKLKVLNL